MPLDDARVTSCFREARPRPCSSLKARHGALLGRKPSRLEDLIAQRPVPPGPMDLIPASWRASTGAKWWNTRTRRGRDAVRDLRHHGLPGTGDADRADPGRLAAWAAPTCCAAPWARRKEEMDQHRDIFRAGASRMAFRRKRPTKVFDLMEKFAGYGFNKSHAAAYSLLAYHTAWIKVHYTAEFFCANMTVEMDNTDKLKVLFEDAEKMGLALSHPTSTAGVYRFGAHLQQEIRYGLGAVKGTGQQAIEAIVAAREGNGPGEKKVRSRAC